MSNELLHLSLKDVLIGVIAVQCPLLNYFLFIAKLHLWDCRRSQIRPTIAGFKVHLTPKYFCRLNRFLHLFETHCAFLPLFNPNLDFTGCKSYEIWPSSVTRQSKYGVCVDSCFDVTNFFACMHMFTKAYCDANQFVTSNQK